MASSKTISSILQATFLSFCLTLFGGCAVQKTQNGVTQIGIDEAAIFGKVVQTFKLPDGSEARLRVLNGRYSLKLEKQMRVIPVENAAIAEALSVQQFGDRVVVLLTKSSPQCSYQNQLIAIRGNEALSWDTGDCWHKPVVKSSSDALTLDYQQDRGDVQRFLYKDGRLNRSYLSSAQAATSKSANTTTATTSWNPIPPQSPRYVPSIPNLPDVNDVPDKLAVKRAPLKISNISEKSVTKLPVLQVKTSTSTAASKNLEFQTQEQKPVRIILDK